VRTALPFGLLVAAVLAACSSTSSPATRATTESLTGAVTYETVVDLVRTRNLRTIDDLLAQPEFSVPFRRGFTAMFRSQSLQHADPLNPRIILYGQDAKLVLAFTCATGDCVGTGGPAVANGDHLEMVQWRDDSKSFEYRDIAFPETGTATGVSDPVFSEANPQQCLGCHTASDPRPNWEPYNQWPGAYGGNDDGAQPKYLTAGESRAELDQFLQTGETRPRYRRLTELVDGYQYIYSYGGETYEDARTAKNHNIDLNEALYLLNDERIADRILKLPFYADIKHALILGLGDGAPSDPLRAIGETALGSLLDQCTRSDQEASRVIKLLYGLGVDSLPLFMSFPPSLDSELVAPAFGVEGKVEGYLFDADPSLRQDYDTRAKLAQDGWKRLLAERPSVRDSIKKCASERL
jgi:hypothetical protein